MRVHGPLGRRARRRDHRHRVLRARSPTAAEQAPRGDADDASPSPASSPRSPRLPLRRLARRSRRSSAASPRAASSASAARPARRSTSRRAAPARSTARPTAEEIELADAAPSRRSASSTCRSSGRRSPRRTSRRTSCSTAPTSPFLHLILDIPADEVRMGMRVKAVWKPARRVGHHDREHQPLRADRRARRGLRHLQAPPLRGLTMRDVAVVGFAQRQMQEFDGSPTCVELLVPILAECYEQTGWTRTRHRLLVLRLVRLPGRPVVLVRPGGRRDRRHAAGQRVARRDGRRLGALRGLDEDPDRRGRHRARLRLRQVARPACCAGSSRCSSTPTR